MVTFAIYMRIFVYYLHVILLIMEEKFKFTGPKNGYDLDLEENVNGLSQFHKKGKEKIEGEFEKTPEQIEMIRTVNQTLISIFSFLDIKEKRQINVDQVHFLSDSLFKENCRSNDYGQYNSVSDSISINLEKIGNDKAHLFATLLHESVHAVSERHFFADKKDADNTDISDARVGFRLNSQWKRKKSILRGFNEFIVNEIVYYSINKIAKSLEGRFGITKKDLEGSIYSDGVVHQKLIETIYDKLNKNKEVDESYIAYIAKTHFSGSLRILDPVDKSYGKGSVRVLGCLDMFGDDDIKKDKVNNMVEEYFLHADEKRKSEIRDILTKITNEN